MAEKKDYVYKSKEEYAKINREIVLEEKSKHETMQNSIHYKVDVMYYEDYEMYYLIMPDDYLNNIEELRQNKNDIFAKGKILNFSKKNFSFDAVIDSSEEDPDKEGVVYAYLVPIKEEYQYSKDITGYYDVQERIGDLTYERMLDAINQFVNGNYFSKNLEKYILGENITKKEREFKNIFNYEVNYFNFIYDFAQFTQSQEKKFLKVFYREMNTMKINYDKNKNLICLMIYAIYQCRKNIHDKILICSSSNSSADSIALDLLKLQEHVKKFNLLRIYAKNQEKIKRNKRLNQICFHQLMKRRYKKKFNNRQNKKNWLIQKNDIIISTCVNSYNDDLINYKFPFVIIIDADNSNENENLIPITLNAKHVLLIAYEGDDTEDINLYKRMKFLYPENHYDI